MTPSEASLVSVVVPVFDGERHLPDAIRSVLQQRDPGPFEIIVVDDGSEDGSAAVAESFPEVRLLRQAINRGPGAARNEGIQASRGAYVALLDADDIWLPTKLRDQRDYLDRHPDVDLVFAAIEVFGKNGARTLPEHASGLLPSAMLARRGAFDRVGLFDTSLRLGDFIDWYARAIDLGLVSDCLQALGVRRRIHDNNMGIRDRDRRVDYTRAVRTALRRRRGDG